MEKKILYRDLLSFAGSHFINKSAIRRFIGRGKATTNKLLEGLDYEQTGKEKIYYVRDVVDRIAERQVRG